MRVAHLTTISLSLRHLLLNQMQSIQAAGYEVVGLSARGSEVADIERAGIPHIAVPLTRKFAPLKDLRGLWELYRLFRRERFAIVHTHTAKPGLLGLLAARWARVPVIVHTIHGYHFGAGTPRWLRRFYIALERLAARRADVLLSQGRAEVQLAITEKICPPDKIKLLGNGIDLPRFDPRRFEPPDRAAQRAQLGLNENDLVVGFVGRLVAEKGLHELLQAARIVREQVPNVKFLLVGATDADKSDAVTPDVARRYGVAEVCVFAGQREDMPELYAVMDVFALPSHREGFPRAPMEAAAMGLPMVVSDVAGCLETVVPDETGLVVPSGDAVALAAALTALLTHPLFAAQLGRAARRHARRHFDEQKVFAKVLAEYAKLLHIKGLAAATKIAKAQRKRLALAGAVSSSRKGIKGNVGTNLESRL